jgi:predicted phosphohydrolase
MKIFALSDLHLAFATPGKSMAVFGEHWNGHAARIERHWRERVGEEDLVLVAGDISWAMRLDDALPDLEFIARLPGRKVLIRGNHDYWWNSPSKIRQRLPEGLYIIQNDALKIDGVALAGSRLWNDREMPPMRLKTRSTGDSAKAAEIEVDEEKDEKIFVRELGRLEMSLNRLPPEAPLKVAMVHYPPVTAALQSTRATALLEAAGVHHCVFGHLHNLVPSPGRGMLGARLGVMYHLTSCDYLDFIPTLVTEV